MDCKRTCISGTFYSGRKQVAKDLSVVDTLLHLHVLLPSLAAECCLPMCLCFNSTVSTLGFYSVLRRPTSGECRLHKRWRGISPSRNPWLFFFGTQTFSAWEQSETVQVWKHHVCPCLCLCGCTANLNSIQWPNSECKFVRFWCLLVFQLKFFYSLEHLPSLKILKLIKRYIFSSAPRFPDVFVYPFHIV